MKIQPLSISLYIGEYSLLRSQTILSFALPKRHKLHTLYLVRYPTFFFLSIRVSHVIHLSCEYTSNSLNWGGVRGARHKLFEEFINLILLN